MDFDQEKSEPLEKTWVPVFPDIPGAEIKAAAPEIWALVLEARYVPNRIELHGDSDSRQLLVPPHLLQQATDEITLFEEENRNWPPPPVPAAPEHENLLSTVSILLLLAIFHNLIQLHFFLPPDNGIDFIDIGRARASDIVRGEWWRAVTALTLHAGVVHLASNVLVGGFIIVTLCRSLGAGFAWSLSIASGAAGNLVNSYVQLPTHASVGASSAVFGAVGILTAANISGENRHPRRWLLPAAAGLGLLATLGTGGQNTDLGGHFFGFLSGVVFGAAVFRSKVRSWAAGRTAGNLLGWLSAAIVAGSWMLAIVFRIR